METLLMVNDDNMTPIQVTQNEIVVKQMFDMVKNFLAVDNSLIDKKRT